MVAQDGNAESVQYLIEGGANIDARNARGQSALHLAALAQSPETVEFLLKSGELRSRGNRLFLKLEYGASNGIIRLCSHPSEAMMLLMCIQ